MKPIRLCIVGNLLGRNPGYVTTQGQIVADLFERSGYDVTSVSSRINRVYRLVDMVSTVLNKRHRLDVVIIEVYSGMAFLLADAVSFITKYFRIPTVCVLHGGNLPEFMGKLPRWSVRVLNRADMVVTPSPFLANAVGKYGLRPRILPNVINLTDYRFRPRKNIKPKLIWMRSFHATYNPLMALDVLAITRRRYPDATLVMAGVDKGLESAARDKAKRLGLDHAVRFPGFLDTKAKIREFSNADIYLNTNRVDNMPVSVVEACAMGLPVIATNVGGISDLLSDGHNGLIVPDDDDQKMAEAIMRLLDDPDLAGRLSKNGRLLAERSSWESVRKDWERVFAEITGRVETRAIERASVGSV